MFSADLSWTDPQTETVGARKQRIAREQAASGSSGSIRTVKSARSSISADRDLWWAAGLKKARSIRPNVLKHTTNRSVSQSQKSVHSTTTADVDVTFPREYKDPTLQPDCTYSSSFSPTLPSGASLNNTTTTIPELEADTASRHTNSTDSRFAPQDRRWEVKTTIWAEKNPDREKKQRRRSGSFLTIRTRASSAATERKDSASAAGPLVEEPDEEWVQDVSAITAVLTDARARTSTSRPKSMMTESSLNLESLKLAETRTESRSSDDTRHTSINSTNSGSKYSDRPLSQWDSLEPHRLPQPVRVQTPTKPAPATTITITRSSPRSVELTRFQRFIRRMENAGPKVVLDRLKEEWQEPAGEEPDEEVALEKQLWLLTGFQMQNLGKERAAPKPECSTGRILELYGNLSEVYQLSAMHPSQTVHFLTTKPQRPIPLPGNVSYMTVQEFGAVPLPYPEDYFSHIRASTLPSLVPSARLPELFRECYKLLAPGGLLEVRVIDAAPVRRTSGPLMKMWIEDRLSVGLERLFRCSKPCLLVPGWLADSGFELIDAAADQNVILPCAYDKESSDVNKELSTIIGQAMWKDIWGSFVEDIPGESKWWWEDEGIIQECLKRETVFECKAIFAYKR